MDVQGEIILFCQGIYSFGCLLGHFVGRCGVLYKRNRHV
nr:MAG TPA: hypothetical protein [Caudoviricetes sp.]